MSPNHAFGGRPRSAKRHPRDAYETPTDVTNDLLTRVDFAGTVTEPAAGTGRIARVLRRWGYDVETDDISRGPRHDFLLREEPAQNFVTNPPYSDDLPFRFARHAFDLVRAHPEPGKVALLLKHGFLWSKGRRSWLREHPPSAYIVITRRILFLNPDGARIKGQFFDHLWVVWDVRHTRSYRPEVHYA